MIEQPYPLRADCANCPEPAGGRGVLRHSGDHRGVVSCAVCHTPNFAVVVDETTLHPEIECPDCKTRLRIAPGGNCPQCGLTAATMTAVKELLQIYASAAANVITERDKVIGLLLSVAVRVPV